MNLKRQLLLVSLLTLMLPWAGCEFIRETESALRAGQQQMLAGTARALARSMTQYAEEYPNRNRAAEPGEQLYLHQLTHQPRIDGYFDDWSLGNASLRSLRGTEGPVTFALASFGGAVFLYVEVSDRDVVYATAQTMIVDDGPRYADRVSLVSSSPPYLQERFIFTAEAPGQIVSLRQDNYMPEPEREPAITAYWQDVPGGYRVEARIPATLLGTNLGIVISNTPDESQRATRVLSYRSKVPPAVARLSPELRSVAEALVQEGMRLILTDAAGWRIAVAGGLSATVGNPSISTGWSRRIYELLVESGEDAGSAEPDASGREQQPYVSAALDGRETADWFRSEASGRAVVAVAAPVAVNDAIVGAIVLQQGTDAILSLTNASLARLINLTLITTLVVAGVLLGYATWLSRRIRHLSVATEAAMDSEQLQAALPSALAEDEIGDLSRSFSSVLRQLDDYNAYLRSLASKLSHELRTPLAIVTSSLENLEHESLTEASSGYTARAREGADRLRRILNAMSEANRVEELMQHAESEVFDLVAILGSTVEAYRDVYADRSFEFDCAVDTAPANGSPELFIQLLDKLVDNAFDFSQANDTISIRLDASGSEYCLSVMNPGQPLPERMRSQLFDSMVSVRDGKNTHNLGLGLYIARLIAEGHGGDIAADNADGGVVFTVTLPRHDSR